jgi:uncharacterized protein (DUF362 family)
MDKSVVALTRCTNYEPDQVSKCLRRQFELLGGMSKFVKSGDTVLLKPNMIAPKSRRHAAQTDPAVILELAKILKDYGARPFVGDSPAWTNIYTCVQKLRLDEPLKKLGVPVRQLRAPVTCRLESTGLKVGISRIALNADVIINLPKFKSHQQLTATFAVKNVFGCVSGKSKALWHFRKGKTPYEFCSFLIDIYKFLNPALTIIDAVTAMEGPGPINGRARPLGWLIGGTDPVSCEVVCARLINTEPMEFPIIKTARQIGFGCSDEEKIEINGDNYKGNICTDFKPAKLIPIRFSLPHVCKSIFKQLLLLLKFRKP